ncbi:Dyak\GE18831-PA-like protein [Anopheles sinensis]|uniref:Dyak\GE18831-PA-like protein n=1 Tax=Anopheles sinensis TaxID=74873 RepID=A0A084VQT4_ANOSI|nr:Dyak\GE18831-PA-like protein [Anopheles sinensis]
MGTKARKTIAPEPTVQIGRRPSKHGSQDGPYTIAESEKQHRNDKKQKKNSALEGEAGWAGVIVRCSKGAQGKEEPWEEQ